MEAVCHLRKTLQNMLVRRSSRHSKPASNKWLDKVFTAVVFVFEDWTVQNVDCWSLTADYYF